MRRFAVLLALSAAAAGCNPNATGSKVIAEQCIADGESIEMCECLGKESAERLDQPLFDLVVLGAQGAEAEAAARMEEMPADLKMRFSAVIPEIRRTCEAVAAAATDGAP